MLIVLCLFMFLFCSVAAQDFLKGGSLSPEINKTPLPHPVERYNHLIAKSAAYLRNPLNASPTRDDGPDSDPLSQGDKDRREDEEAPAEKPGTAAARTEEAESGNKPLAGRLPVEDKNSIHFLLVGRWWDDPVTEVLVMVTLIPGGCARLTSLDPAIGVQLEGEPCPLGEMLKRGGSREQLHRAVTSLTGLAPQFYIDLNLHGFIEMIGLLQKRTGAAASPPAADSFA